MGRWSPAYYDDLLHMKFRSLTYNSVDKLRKLKVEDDLVDLNPEPRITHEQFIQALDVTDSFTQRLIEILVQEVAARRHSNRTNRGNTHSTVAHSARTANALLALSEQCRGLTPSHSLRRSEFLFGPHAWDAESDETEDVGMDESTPEPDSMLFGEHASLTLGSRIGSSLREAAAGSSSSSQWRPLDLIFSPPSRAAEVHSPPPPPAPSTRPHSGLLSLVSARYPSRYSSIRRPASASSVAYLRPRQRTADFEVQTERLRERARTRALVDYVRGDGSNGSRSQAPPESFARREIGTQSDDETDSRLVALPPAPVPAHAHVHSHNSLRRVTSELSTLDWTPESHYRELSVAREEFATRFRRGVSSNLTPIDHRSPSPMAGPSSSSQPRESLRAALWGTGPSEQEGLPTPRSLTPESGARGPSA